MTTWPGSFYLGRGGRRLPASTWDDIESAAADGLLEESAWVEFKQAVPTGKGPNVELAKDLASLSVDGGAFVVGVTDKLKVVGFSEDPASLRTRIVQVAATRINPPLFVNIDFLPRPPDAAPASDGDGPSGDFLAVVRVPASGGAPHMADGSYWGRSNEGKRKLADQEVQPLMLAREARARSLTQELYRLESDLGPLGGARPERSHLAFYARPRGVPRATITDALQRTHPPQIVNQAADFTPSFAPWSHLQPMHSFHPDGIALSSDDARFNRIADEESAYRLLLHDNGSLSGLAGGASAEVSQEEYPFDQVVCGYLLEGIHVMTRLAAYVAAEHLEYWAEWDVGVFVNNLSGRWPADRAKRKTLDMHPFPKAEFLHTTAASTREMLETPAAVASRLMLPMLRTFGVAEHWLPYEEGSQIALRA